METEHAAREWVCHSQRHPELSFSDQYVYMEHIRNSHDSKLTKVQLLALAQASSRPSSALFDECPFGDELLDGKSVHLAPAQNQPLSGKDPSTGKASAKREDPKRILRHVGEHLQLLATMSLAWLGQQATGGDSQDAGSLSSRSSISDTPPVIPDLDEISVEDLTLPCDPAWSRWVSEDHSHAASREEEWSLSNGAKILRVFLVTVEDPMIWEFTLKFGAVEEEIRRHYTLLPPESSTLAQAGSDSLPNTIKAPGDDVSDSDSENEMIQRRRLLESSERVMKSIQEKMLQRADTMEKLPNVRHEEPSPVTKDVSKHSPRLRARGPGPGDLALRIDESKDAAPLGSPIRELQVTSPKLKLVSGPAADFIESRLQHISYDPLWDR
jgi:hypothetical protein